MKIEGLRVSVLRSRIYGVGVDFSRVRVSG